MVDDSSWKEPGFHRPLAGFFYNLVFIFLASGFGILLTIWLIPNLIYPFPEALGFENVTAQVFVVYFQLLDLGIGAAIQRFVGEENVKKPRDSVKYIQFFIWYQMFSGLFQITTVTFYAIYFVPNGELAYASWMFLLYSLIQYPGMLGIFKGALEAYQRLDRANLLTMIHWQVGQNIFRIIFILLGRKMGINNPAVGELLGATYGSIVGKYVNEFAMAALGGIWLRPILKDIDPEFGIHTLFKVEFDWPIAKKCLIFGLKALTPTLISPISNFASLLLLTTYLPNYSTILGLFTFASMLATMVTTFAFPGVASSLAESYLNGKIKLSRNYLQNFYRWNSVVSFFLIGMLFSGGRLIGIIAGGNFALAIPMIQNLLILYLFQGCGNIISNALNGVGKPGQNIILMAVEQSVRLFILWLLLVPFPSSWLALVYSTGIAWLARWITGHLLFEKKVFKVKINWWQTFVATSIAAFFEALFFWAAIKYIYPLLTPIFPEILAAVVLMLTGVFIGPFLIFFPMYAFWGGMDDDSFETLEKAYHLTGPSKGVVKFIIRSMRFMSKISPLHNRFKSDISGVEEEVQQLMLEKKEHLANELP